MFIDFKRSSHDNFLVSGALHQEGGAGVGGGGGAGAVVDIRIAHMPRGLPLFPLDLPVAFVYPESVGPGSGRAGAPSPEDL